VSLAGLGQPARDFLGDQLEGADVVHHCSEHQLVGAGALEQAGQLAVLRWPTGAYDRAC
jgi:hypothetical protein